MRLQHMRMMGQHRESGTSLRIIIDYGVLSLLTPSNEPVARQISRARELPSFYSSHAYDGLVRTPYSAASIIYQPFVDLSAPCGCMHAHSFQWSAKNSVCLMQHTDDVATLLARDSNATAADLVADSRRIASKKVESRFGTMSATCG